MSSPAVPQGFEKSQTSFGVDALSDEPVDGSVCVLVWESDFETDNPVYNYHYIMKADVDEHGNALKKSTCALSYRQARGGDGCDVSNTQREAVFQHD